MSIFHTTSWSDGEGCDNLYRPSPGRQPACARAQDLASARREAARTRNVHTCQTRCMNKPPRHHSTVHRRNRCLRSTMPAASGDNVDLQLEISTSEAFLQYRFMENIQKYLQASHTSMCKMGLHSMPALVPSSLHPDRFFHISGEVFSELACITITVTAMIVDQPVTWLLPVQHEGKLVFL